MTLPCIYQLLYSLISFSERAHEGVALLAQESNVEILCLKSFPKRFNYMSKLLALLCFPIFIFVAVEYSSS